MGRLFNYLSILVMIDLLFLFTIGVDTQATLTSAIANFTSNPIIEVKQPDGSVRDENNLSGIFLSFLLTIGVGTLIGTSLAWLTKSESFIYVGFASGILYTIAVDYFYIYLKLYRVAQLSAIIAAFILVPTLVTFLLTLVEWLRGKD